MSLPGQTIKNDYAALPGNFVAASIGRSRAYVGPNHVLSIRMHGAHEVVRRFYYGDITGLGCFRTSRGQRVNAVLALCAALPWLPLLVTGQFTGLGLILAGAVSAFFGLLLVVNMSLGATCATWLHTSNHTERLASLGRYRVARKAIAQIDERVTAVQGSRSGLDHEDQAPRFSLVAKASPAGKSGAPLGRPWPVALLYWISIALTWSFLIDFTQNIEWKNTLDSVAIAVASVLAPIAVFRMRNRRAAQTVRVTATLLLTFYVVAIPLIFFLQIVLVAMDPMGVVEKMAALKGIASLSPADGSVYYVMIGYHILSIVVMGLCGVSGLFGLVLGRNQGK